MSEKKPEKQLYIIKGPDTDNTMTMRRLFVFSLVGIALWGLIYLIFFN